MNRNGELFINDKDAFKQWGLFINDKSLSTLIEPEPLKEPLTNKTTVTNGKQVRRELQPKVDERDVTLTFQIYALSRYDLFAKLIALKTELKKRRCELRTRYEPNVIYRLDYKSCTQYKSHHNRLATFSVRFNEPNPANRAKQDTDQYEDTDI